MDLNIIQKICVWALPMLFAITLHEAAHAFAAKRFGDPTAFLMGRMTLNPIKHIDPVGTILLPLAFIAMGGGFMFGWAKPVPVNFHDLKNPRSSMFWVAAAGPMANLLMTIIWAVLYKLGNNLDGSAFQLPLLLMAQAGIIVNLSFMVLNLLPILPLDGGRMLTSILPRKAAWTFSKLEPYGLWIVIALMFTGVLNSVMQAILAPLYRVVQQIFF